LFLKIDHVEGSELVSCSVGGLASRKTVHEIRWFLQVIPSHLGVSPNSKVFVSSAFSLHIFIYTGKRGNYLYYESV